MLALKLCRRPSEWPTSCITISLIACPINSSGSSSLGSGFFFSTLSLSFSSFFWSGFFVVCRLGTVVRLGHGDCGQAEVALQARLSTGKSPGFPGEVLRELPGEGILIGGDDLGRPSGSEFLSSASMPSKARASGWP